MTTKYPLRTRRKAETRKKIVLAAQDLFYTKGYDATTLEEVAATAGVHVQTLYRHFSNKQELASSSDRRWFEKFKAQITDPARTQTAFDLWRNWLRASFRYLTADGAESYKRYIQVRHANPAILGEMSAIRAGYEDLLCQALAEDYGLPAVGLSKPRLVAGTLLAASSYVLRRFEVEDIDLVEEAVQAVDEVEKTFAPLIRQPGMAMRAGGLGR